jgi:hypothetical protein
VIALQVGAAGFLVLLVAVFGVMHRRRTRRMAAALRVNGVIGVP